MKILLCNPKNDQGTKHSRKGMYAPLGILSIATYIKNNLGGDVSIDVCDEDIEVLDIARFGNYDLVGFYATTFNYGQAAEYAYFAKDYGCLTVLGGPHASVLADKIMANKRCFDYIIKFEAEIPFLQLLKHLLNIGKVSLEDIVNLVYRSKSGEPVSNKGSLVNDLMELPIPSRDFVDFNRYIKNCQDMYPQKENFLAGSIYSCKGCSWRDKTGGCVFCARLEQGLRFRDIDQIWSEIELLKDKYSINSIWDISDDNLNNKEWFKKFVDSRPRSCQNISFFIYSRVNMIQPQMIPLFKELNVEEVFLGVESGDNSLLKKSFKGQSRDSILKAIKLLRESSIKYFPSIVLGLPDESIESLENTYRLCQEISGIGGLDRMSTTTLKPIPGSRSFEMVIDGTSLGKDLRSKDEIDLSFLEQYWALNFTKVDFKTILEYKNKIDGLMKEVRVFGSSTQKED
ncbi:MAG: B12-binding domain-containing radical SAM protein [Candidatus Omnitrophica bacterium]|nr:B12-binding domain-containing radical SAM protein [Candidatus Omnitrophota bacterium]